MSTDRDASRVSFKVNAAGSWANLVTCDPDRIGAVKAACEVIANSGTGAKFKMLDASGGEIETYCYNRRSGRVHWHAPGRVA